MEEKILIGLSEINEAKALFEKAFEQGIELELKHNPATCPKGCMVRVEIWANKQDVHDVAQIINDKNTRILDNEGLNINKELLETVFDEEAKTAICPACGTEFSTDNKECPDCGLVFIP